MEQGSPNPVPSLHPTFPRLPFLLPWQCPLDALDTAALSGGPGVSPPGKFFEILLCRRLVLNAFWLTKMFHKLVLRTASLRCPSFVNNSCYR